MLAIVPPSRAITAEEIWFWILVLLVSILLFLTLNVIFGWNGRTIVVKSYQEFIDMINTHDIDPVIIEPFTEHWPELDGDTWLTLGARHSFNGRTSVVLIEYYVKTTQGRYRPKHELIRQFTMITRMQELKKLGFKVVLIDDEEKALSEEQIQIIQRKAAEENITTPANPIQPENL